MDIISDFYYQYYYYYYFSTPTMLTGALFVLLIIYSLILLSWSRLPIIIRSTTKNIKNNSSINQAPEAAGAWPVIGHLHQLADGQNLLHATLGAMADKYGPAFTIRMGLHKALVVSSWEVAKECFTTNDKIFAFRPPQQALKHLGYGSAMFPFSPYGPYYLEMRKIVNRELLSNSRLDLLKHVWGSEINTSMKQLYEELGGGRGGGPVLVDMKKWFSDLMIRTTVKVICGKRKFVGAASNTTTTSSNEGDDEAAGRCQKAVREFFRLLGQFQVSDVIPFLGWLDVMAGNHKREMKSNGRELDCLMEEWLEEHKIRKKGNEGDDEAERKKKKKKGDTEHDFMDLMMSVLDDHAKLLSYYDADTINKSTCLTLIVGGSDTMMISLVWALSLLVNHPHVLRKAQDELDSHVGKERQVDESDIKNLIYFQAVVKETLRLCPPGPLLTPRESTEDCTIAGYHVPAGTRLLVNIWKIQRDPRVWSDPSKFQPDRFLTGSHANMDVRGQNFELIPFGLGRRSCPGTNLALQVVRLTLARLIHGFEFKTPSNTPIDMTGSAGITNAKATPLDVLVTPRLPSKLYM